MKIKVKKLHHDAKIPQYASPGAACFDLHALTNPEHPSMVNPGTPATFRTGLSVEIPAGCAMFIFSRSGHGFKNDVRLANCVGIIDSDYRGEIQVKLTNDNSDGCSMTVNNGDRIAQAMIVPVQTIAFIEADDLSETERGAGGFGSTGQ